MELQDSRLSRLPARSPAEEGGRTQAAEVGGLHGDSGAHPLHPSTAATVT